VDDLKTYLESRTPQERRALAQRCGTSVDYLWQIANGLRTPKAALAVAISRESAGAVRCERLLPGVDWDYLRGQATNAARA
jgi:DNA-binding transcriptional regulator YdaS (Cro superfamily)